jgi:hypothetical protein
VTALLMTVSLMGLLALPAFAQGSGDPFQIALEEQNNSGISGGAEFKDQGDGTTAVSLVVQGVAEKGEYPAHIHSGKCPEVGDITYPLEPVKFDANASGAASPNTGWSVTILDAPIDEILAQQSAVNVHLSTDPSVYVACGDLPMAGELEDIDDHETVSRTFELTLNGTVPADQAFHVGFTAVHDDGAVSGTDQILWCGQVQGFEPQAKCEGGGTVYRRTVEITSALREFPAGTVLQAQWRRFDGETGASEEFLVMEEPLDADMPYTAEYTFGGGAGDDDVGPTVVPIEPTTEPAPAEPTTGPRPQPTEGMPTMPPKAGAGGLATGASVPWGTMGLAATCLLAAGYAVIRRR